MYNNFNLDKPFDLKLDPPSSENPPLCRIIQEGKDPIITTDFYLTNIEPKPWILPTAPQNEDIPKPSGAAGAADYIPEILDFIPGCYIHPKLQFPTLGKKP